MVDFSCVVIGDDRLTTLCAEQLRERAHEIRCVLTDSADVEAWANEHGIEIVSDRAALVALLPEGEVDYVFSIANLRLLPQRVRDIARSAAINFHDGPLPRYPGVHAPSWALAAGETTHGVTWHLMTEEVDAGDILVQRTFDLDPEETSYSINTKCLEAGFSSFAELVENLESGTPSGRAHEVNLAEYSGPWRRPSGAGLLSWNLSTDELWRTVRVLDYGPERFNPLGVPKLMVGGHVYTCDEVSRDPRAPGRSAGTVLSSEGDLRVATLDGQLTLGGLRGADGAEVGPSELLARHGVELGERLEFVEPSLRISATETHEVAARRESFWRRRLADAVASEAPYGDGTSSEIAGSQWGPSFIGSIDRTARTAVSRVELPESVREAMTTLWPDADAHDRIAALFVLYLSRFSGEDTIGVGVPAERDAGLPPGLVADVVPWTVTTAGLTTQDAGRAALDELVAIREAGTHFEDLWRRDPALRAHHDAGLRPGPRVVVDSRGGQRTLAGAGLAGDGDVDLLVRVEGPSTLVLHSLGRSGPSAGDLDRIADQVAALAGDVVANPQHPVGELGLLSESAAALMLDAWNEGRDRGSEWPTVLDEFERQVRATPAATAVTVDDHSVTYAEVAAQAVALAQQLAERGVGPGDVVGIAVSRSIELVTTVVGVLGAGAAYLPLDPTYPTERLAFMLSDSGASVVVTEPALARRLPLGSVDQLLVGGEASAVSSNQSASTSSAPPSAQLQPPTAPQPDDLAYVIYTSGSTGKPKGVMVEHRNVTSFFAGMDDRVAAEPGDRWLAVTSLSFDISVLELLWTLCRGLHVVIDRRDSVSGGASPEAQHPKLSLFYFAAQQPESGEPVYRLLLEGARFADEHGFAAVWTPERHFHSFGGPYPNPALSASALAMVTERVELRSGSVVAPLHSPVRIAEDWSVVDNLSGGRVGVAFASGWMPEDFVIRPDAYEGRREATFEALDIVRRLWRGETVELPGPHDDMVSVATLPRPIQPELPVWVTTAGNRETFVEAGRRGAGVLTHLLGQSLAEVSDNVAAYRSAWQRAGHPGRGSVALMVHTFVGPDDAAIEVARPALEDYLRSATDLLRPHAEAFPTFRGRAAGASSAFRDLSGSDLDSLVAFAADRYLRESGLFGSVETAEARIGEIVDADVDEVACLIDFGIDTDTVLDHLDHLAALRRRVHDRPEQRGDGDPGLGVGALIERYDITHLQCTPSMARLMLADPETRSAMGRLQMMLVGGEACSNAVADQLKATVGGAVVNMYGPTETTIWSTTHDLTAEWSEGPVPIGRPIAGTEVYVLNEAGSPQPIGVPGELWIGGPGVTRGYHGRPELTDERFVEMAVGARRPRLYRTGDLVRPRADGVLEFLGRNDHQVKIRGHRIELGEIESALNAHDAVAEGVVVAASAGSTGEPRLVGHAVLRPGTDVDGDDLRRHLAARLPVAMVPTQVKVLPEFPTTLNGKIDRSRLASAAPPARERRSSQPPSTDTEREMARVWSEVLERADLDRNADFFDVGGDSLAVVEIAQTIAERFQVDVSIGAFVRARTLWQVAELVDRRRNELNGASGNASGRPWPNRPDAPSESAAATGNGRHSSPNRPNVDGLGVELLTPNGSSGQPVERVGNGQRESDDAVQVRRMELDDIEAVIDLHLQHFGNWRVSQLGRGFLRANYRWYLDAHPELALVAHRSGSFCGFTVGTVGAYKGRLVKSTWPQLAAGALRHPTRLGELWRGSDGDAPSSDITRDSAVADNRAMATSSTGDVETSVALLAAFEREAHELGLRAHFHRRTSLS